jgi:hypothetical protein
VSGFRAARRQASQGKWVYGIGSIINGDATSPVIR